MDFSFMMKRDALSDAIIGASIWHIANELPTNLKDNVKAVRKILKLDKDKHDSKEMMELLTNGAKLGIELFLEELSRPSGTK